MNVLVGCEFSGTVRDAFTARGHHAVSCDLKPSSTPGEHYQCDVFEMLAAGGPWDLLICHPPCTHLAVSGAAHFKKKKAVQKESLEFVLALLNCDVPLICLENPVSIISSRIREPDQIIQPWMFGDSYQKSTCLWLKNLPKLKPTKIVDPGEFYVSPKGKKYPQWMQNKGEHRSVTFQGIANAMADQWGKLDPQRRDGFGLEFKHNFRKKT